MVHRPVLNMYLPQAWTDICPSLVTFHNITDPYNMEATPEPEFQAPPTPVPVSRMQGRPAEPYYNMSYDQASGLEALSAAATGSLQYTGMRPMSVVGTSAADATHPSPHSSNNLNFILNPAGPEGSLGKSLRKV